MLLRPFLPALLCATLTLLLPASSRAESAGSPAGSAAVGGYLDTGSKGACAVQKDRLIRCWGGGAAGRLGGGQLDARLASPGTAATTVNVGAVAQLAVGDAHACALLAAGAVRCWGQGSSGQLGGPNRDNRGDGYADPLSGTDDPTTVPLGAPAVQITAGSSFSCAVVTGGFVRCWGEGANGRLGSRGTDNRLDGLADGPTDDPSVVPLASAAVAVSAGDQHACALLVGGAVQCWGAGANGRLGSGATDDRLDGILNAGGNDEASTVPLAGAAVAISAGGAHTCALLAGGTVSCWGDSGYGQTGGGNTQARLDGVGTGTSEVATTVPLRAIGSTKTTDPLIPAVAISAGDSHSCAILNTGDVRCWGYGNVGQLGQGAKDSRSDASLTSTADAPARVGYGIDGKTGGGLGGPAIAISAGWGATCAELSSGAVRCWGSGDDGRLGSSAADARLDGVVDPATGTDDASIVPLGALPAAFNDLVALPSPAAAGGPAAAGAGLPPGAVAKTPTLLFTVKVKGKSAKVAVLLVPKKAGKCPKKVTATIALGKKKLGKASLKVKKKSPNCSASGTVRLSAAIKSGKKRTVTITGSGVTKRVFSATK